MSENTPREPEANIEELPTEAITGEEAEDVKGGALATPPEPIRNLNPHVKLNPSLKNTGNL